MAFPNLNRLLIIIQFLVICSSHATQQDVILSPNEFSGKYVKFNRLIEHTTKIPWEEPLKESAKIALSSPNVNKDMLLKAPYVGASNFDPSAFGDIVILAKGKLKKFVNETYLFEEIHDVCEYHCQNNADKYLENVTALWMVERIRHRDAERGYRYDLKFTIVPIFSGRNALVKSNNLEERLRNILKKTFILRDSDYPKYFQKITPKITRRADINRSMSSSYIPTPNHVMHPAYGYAHPPKMNHLNMGEFFKKPPYVIPKPPSISTYYSSNINHRYPIRFPDSRENYSSLNKLPVPYRAKPVRDDEEKQEAHIINNIVDHRGAVELNNNNKQHIQSASKPIPGRSPSLYVSQPAILLPQMPISLVHISPYPVPLVQVSTPPNQMIYSSSQQQPDVTTFRYPTFFNSHQVIPQFQYIQNKTVPSIKNFKESERIVKQPSFSHPDPVYHSSSSTTDKPIYPTMYTPKLSNYVTASSIQINSYDNNDFQPIIAPYSVGKNSNKKIYDEKSQGKYSSRHATHKERIKATVAPIITTTLPTPYESSSTTGFPKNHQQVDYGNYDIVATRPSVTKRTTEKPILKWLPKRHRNKTSQNVTTTIAPQVSYSISSSSSVSVENNNFNNKDSTQSQSTVHPTIKASTHSQIFRGRNRFYNNSNNNKRNSNTSTVTSAAAIDATKASKSSSSTLSSIVNNQNLKQFRRKSVTTTLLPITTQPPNLQHVTADINIQTSTVFPTYVTSPYETKEPITQSSYSTLSDTTASTYELIPADIETISTNESNIKIYKASEFSDEIDVNADNEKEKIDEIASTILKHAKSVGSDAKKTTIK